MRRVALFFSKSGRDVFPRSAGEAAGHGIRDIPQQMIWNCRCTLAAWVKGFEPGVVTSSPKMGDMTFEEWLEAKPQPRDIEYQTRVGESIRQGYVNEYKAVRDSPIYNSGQDGIINAKLTDRMVNYHVDNEATVYSFEEIESALQSSVVGRDAAKYIEDNGFTVSMNYDLNVTDLAGAIYKKEIVIYPHNNLDSAEVSATIIHELCHERYGWIGTQADEVNCRLMEVMHTEGDVTEMDIERIVAYVRREYGGLPEGELYGY